MLDADLKFNDTEVVTDFLITNLYFPLIYFESIIINLVSNSLKYRKVKERPQIIISTYKDEDTGLVVLEYQDNGMGIDLVKNGDKVFGLYKTFTTHTDAHGVGLFLVKTQVESQGGQILIDSQPNVGTRFKILFDANN